MSDLDPHLARPAAALRLYVGGGPLLMPGLQMELPDTAARHAQVRRVQPGDELRLFDGQGRDWQARVTNVGRKQVSVEVGSPRPVALELPTAVTLAVVVPANERMDSLVEKATELGMARLQPLMSERSVLRLAGERAERRQAHWQAVAVAACEQCGRARVPEVMAVQALLPWLQSLGAAVAGQARWVLSLDPRAVVLAGQATQALISAITLSGPEGGLAAEEEAAAAQAGFEPVGLGPRVLRADTAPLAAMAWLSLRSSSVA